MNDAYPGITFKNSLASMYHDLNHTKIFHGRVKWTLVWFLFLSIGCYGPYAFYTRTANRKMSANLMELNQLLNKNNENNTILASD